MKIKYLYANILIISFSVFLIINCSKKEKIEAEYKIYLEKEIKEAALDDFIEKIDTVFLETNENSTVGVVGKLYISEERIYILDNYITKSLFVFNKNGKFIDKIQNFGGGPEEYLSLNDFTLDEEKKEILLLADGGRRIIFYDYDMNYIKETKLEISLFSYIFPTGDSYVLGNHVTSGDKNLLYIVDKDFNVKKKYVEISEIYYKMARTGWIAYSGYNENYLFVPTLSPVIYAINENGCYPKYEFHTGKNRMLTHEEMANFKYEDDREFVKETMDYFNLTSFFELTDYLFATFSLDKESYWCLYNPILNKLKYINQNKIKGGDGFNPENLHFLTQLDKETIAGYILDPEREEKEENPMVVLCKLREW